MNKNNKNYSIGIDIGTASVGWSVTDENYNLIKRKGKNMWGVRLFDSAETAESRRVSRSTRRRYNKRRERIRLLRMLMNDMIMDIDQTFFIRMEHTTFLDYDDKANRLTDNIEGNYNLFITKDFNDRHFYAHYPTIYHLRKELCENTSKADPRLIYLALHHIVKYRGNFLSEGQKFSLDNSNVIDKVRTLFSTLFEKNELTNIINENQMSKILDILKSDNKKTTKVENIMKELNVESDYKKIIKEVCVAVVGNSFSIQKLFPNSCDDKTLKLKFSEANYDDMLLEKSDELSEYMDVLEAMHNLYSWSVLQGIVGVTEGEEISISNAMVERYEKHRNDLKKLKSVIKDYCPTEYYDMFRNKELKLENYHNYIHHPNEVTLDKFYKKIIKILNDLPDDERISQIKEDIEKEKFLLKQNMLSNGSVPYQLQLSEMKKILTNQASYYPLLKENMNKIISILTFRIPYYYGPLDGNDKFGWLIKKQGKEDDRIFPWNHEDIVDIDKTSEKFIKKMTNFCTYFKDESVLPKHSLLINKYEVLSELNKMRINNKSISIDTKINIFNKLFMKTKKITEKSLKRYLYDNENFLNKDDIEIKGFQKAGVCSTSLSSWIDFTKIFGEINEDNYELIEEIIYDMTIFEDKKLLRRKLEKTYHNLSKDKIEKIILLNYSGWSRLSRKLLSGIRCDNIYGSSVSIIDVMEMSSLNLMQIISDEKLGFKKIIDDDRVADMYGKFTHKEVEELAGSPAIKKGIWQSLLVVDEIKKIMNCEPKNVFIEFAREEGKKQRTISSIKRLKDIYKDIVVQNKNEKELYNSLMKHDETSKIDNERLYLYYMQMGKCMYTGKPLEIDKLNLYEVDHIVPQSLIKDNSLDNKVLVVRKENQRKADDLVIPIHIRCNMSGFWNNLFDLKLISQKKYFSLNRTEYRDKDQAHFINRQLVETRQITKHVSQIINNHYPNTNVVTIKAGMSHDFRTKYKIYKNRNVNDFHHVHDAYIACILGTYIFKRFPKLETKYIYGEYLKYVSKNKKNKGNDGFILNSMNNPSFIEETGEVIWNNDVLNKIMKSFSYKDYFITKKLEEFDGEFFKLTVQPNDLHSHKGKTIASIPLNKKRSDVHKYGGFEGVKCYPVAIEGIKKGKIVRKITKIPLVFKTYTLEDKIKFIMENEKFEDVVILKEHILKNQLLEIDGGLFYMSSPTELVNAKELILTKDENELVYNINLAISKKEYTQLTSENLISLYIALIEKIKTHYPYYRTIAKNLYENMEAFKKLSIVDKCKVITELLITLQVGPQNGNIKLDEYKLGDRLGRMGGKNIDLNESYFISQSVTGLYSRKYKL